MPAIPLLKISKKDSIIYLMKAKTEFNGINAKEVVRDSNCIRLSTFDPRI